jgi:hypothetical protein
MHSYFGTLASIMASIANKLFNSLLLIVIAQYTRDGFGAGNEGHFHWGTYGRRHRCLPWHAIDKHLIGWMVE